MVLRPCQQAKANQQERIIADLVYTSTIAMSMTELYLLVDSVDSGGRTLTRAHKLWTLFPLLDEAQRFRDAKRPQSSPCLWPAS
eukprot:m.20893 g.20893  ORF g.20893 m.20893 type:complete len:84 (+) comp8978_c0_seq1:10-261(+)